MTNRMFLIGMMGAGKSTIGALLAEQLGWRHLDSDAEVQRLTGRTVPEIFAADGEAAFRRHESLVLAQATDCKSSVVVSVAGGAVLDSGNRARLRKSGLVVWLRADVATLASRVGDGAGRPLLGEDVSAALSRLYEQRRPLYEELAQVTVDVDGLLPEQAAVLIMHRAPVGSRQATRQATRQARDAR
ncbi:MAG: shikimate kinase [Acidimicrobiales bacterium]